MRAALLQLPATLAVCVSLSGAAYAEEFKYYVWVDDEGIVHASEEAPKGRDYEVRIIEDINANVVPAEEFRFGARPGDAGHVGAGGLPSSKNTPAPRGAETGSTESGAQQ